MNGETETGVSIITLADTMDAGHILAQGKTAISPEDTFETMHETLSHLSVPVLMKAIEQLENGTAVYTQQDPSLVTYAPKLQKADGYIDWNKSAEAIVNQIRGLWPWPSAQSVYVSAVSGRHWRIIFSKARAVRRQSKPDDILGQLNDDLQVICGSGALYILELKPAGSHRMDFDAFVNGHQCRPGDLFISAEKALSGPF
jgi:methionyl-tRNA formyltransferase